MGTAQVATSFVRFKVLLEQGLQERVAAELQHMATCEDFSIVILKVCHAGQRRVWPGTHPAALIFSEG